MIAIRLIDEAHQQDIQIKNEPFLLWGRMIPSYTSERWTYTTCSYAPHEVTEMCFPDESYNYHAMSDNTTFLGAYDGETCVGLAVLQEGFFRYLYLYDLKVKADYRKQGIATSLIEEAKKIALQKGYRGIYTQGQDNNLSACLFYLKNGFHIGGLDTNLYRGTEQEGKSDIVFYLDL